MWPFVSVLSFTPFYGGIMFQCVYNKGGLSIHPLTDVCGVHLSAVVYMLLWTCLYMRMYAHWCFYEQFSILLPSETVEAAVTKYHWLRVLFSHSVVSDSLWPHGLQHARPPCPSPTLRVYSNSCALSWWCHPTISPSVVPFFSCPQSFPASGSFPMS